MTHWYRVFAGTDTLPDPAGIEATLAGSGLPVVARFDADSSGWFRAEFGFGPGEPVVVERWLHDEEGVRAELNSWAAHLETCERNHLHVGLMERAVQARQLFTVRSPALPGEEPAERLCSSLCRHLAGVTRGFYQIDRAGFFEADGTLLLSDGGEDG